MATTRSQRALILDADGVFLDERPYWDAALGTALLRAGFAEALNGRWNALASKAFGAPVLQRVAKLRGCNSNFDLAAVLEKALEQQVVRREFARLLEADDLWGAALHLRDAAEQLGDPDASAPDPLTTFGLDRASAGFEQTCATYQQVLFGVAGIDWIIERAQLRESRGDCVSALESCRSLDYELRVCTGRSRREIEAPIDALGLAPYLPSSGITSEDEVAKAQAETGLPALGKPHAFPVLCAVLGYDAARDRILAEPQGAFEDAPTGMVYVGDGWSDYRAIQATRECGVALSYVHVRSPLVSPEQLAAIGSDDMCLGVIDSLTEIPPLLARVRR